MLSEWINYDIELPLIIGSTLRTHSHERHNPFAVNARLAFEICDDDKKKPRPPKKIRAKKDKENVKSRNVGNENGTRNTFECVTLCIIIMFMATIGFRLFFFPCVQRHFVDTPCTLWANGYCHFDKVKIM